MVIGEAAYQQGQQAQTQEEIEKEEKDGSTEASSTDEDKPVEGEVVDEKK